MRRHGKLIWTLYLFAIVGGFALFESLAFREEDGLTLSRFLYDAWHAWPVLGPLIGVGVGILFSHIFWEWSPKLQAAEKLIAQLQSENARLRNELAGRA